MKAILICGGTLSERFLRDMIETHPDAVIYAVDGGLTVADAAGVMPQYLVGDFDTADPLLVGRYETSCITLRHRPEKDATDTELAIDDALMRGADEILLLGATGSRLDHTLANIHMLYKVLLSGKTAWIMNENNRISLHREPFRRKKTDLFGTYVSFLPFFGDVTGVCLSGVKYPLENATLTAGNSLGVSNEAVEEVMEVSFTSGSLLMIEARD